MSNFEGIDKKDWLILKEERLIDRIFYRLENIVSLIKILFYVLYLLTLNKVRFFIVFKDYLDMVFKD